MARCRVFLPLLTLMTMTVSLAQHGYGSPSLLLQKLRHSVAIPISFHASQPKEPVPVGVLGHPFHVFGTAPIRSQPVRLDRSGLVLGTAPIRSQPVRLDRSGLVFGTAPIRSQPVRMDRSGLVFGTTPIRRQPVQFQRLTFTTPVSANSVTGNSDHGKLVHEYPDRENSVHNNSKLAVPFVFPSSGPRVSQMPRKEVTFPSHQHSATTSVTNLSHLPSKASKDGLIPVSRLNTTTTDGTTVTTTTSTTPIATHSTNSTITTSPTTTNGTNSTSTTTIIDTTNTAGRQHFRTYSTPACLVKSSLELCEEDEEYDEEIENVIRTILKDSHITALLRETAIAEDLVESDPIDNSSGSAHARSGLDGFYTPTCGAVRTAITPKRAQTRAGDYAYVINNRNETRQQIIVEKCTRRDESCHLFHGPPTTRTMCRQLHVYRKLFVLSDSGQNITREEVLIPSCCSCFVRHSEVLESGL